MTPIADEKPLGHVLYLLDRLGVVLSEVGSARGSGVTYGLLRLM